MEAKETTGKGDNPQQVMSTGRVRRANFDDLDAILDINNEVYEGRDYMPMMFYEFMHSKDHVMYVYEEDGKLIALMNCLFPPNEKDLFVSLSGRVRESRQGQGVMRPDTNPILPQLMLEHPQVKRYYAATLYTPNIQAKAHEWKVVYIENVIVYHISDRPRLERFLRKGQWTSDSLQVLQPISISYRSGIEWLARSDQLIRHISKYSPEFIPMDAHWVPVRVNKPELRRLISVSGEVLVSFDLPTTANDLASGAAASRPVVLGQERRENKITGFSYSSCLPCKLGVRAEIIFFGDDEDVLLTHAVKHLLHYVRITSSDVTLVIYLYFPETIDARKVEERVREGFGSRIETKIFSVPKAIHYIGEIVPTQSKL